MNWSDIDWRPHPRKLRQFAAIAAVLLATIAVVRVFQQRFDLLALLLFAGAVVSVVIGLTRPQAAGPLFVALTVLTFPIGWVISRLIIAAIYYGVITPIGLLMRLTDRDPLQLKRRSKDSYWTARPNPSVDSYLHQY